MKKKILLFICISALTIGAAGCGQKDNASADAPPVENAQDITETEEPKITVPNVTDAVDNFSVDQESVSAFAEGLQSVVTAQDLETLAELCSYPLYVGFDDGSVSAASEEELLALGKEKVFAGGLLTSVAPADTEELPPSKAGFCLSDGGTANIIFAVNDGKLAVVGINY